MRNTAMTPMLALIPLRVGGWLLMKLIVVLYTDGVTIQLGIIYSGAYSLGNAIESLVDPYEIVGFDIGTISLAVPSTGSSLFVDGDRIFVDSQSIYITE